MKACSQACSKPAIMQFRPLIILLFFTFLLVGCDEKEGTDPAGQAAPAVEASLGRSEQGRPTESPNRGAQSTVGGGNVYPPQSKPEQQQERKVLVYRGTSDASAAVALGEDMFVAADDENNILRVYKIDDDMPVYSYDLSDFLEISSDHPEADIEGATKVGNRVYWIASHGRNKDGKFRPNRYRFFATDIDLAGDKVGIRLAGKPCSTLVRSMLRVRALRDLKLNDAAGVGSLSLSDKDLKKLAPKREGLNIEGLCASGDGRTLYIGFRNPRPNHKSIRGPAALVVPLENAAQIVDRGDMPPILWDFAGLGIRSMEYSPYHKAYFIVAGAFDGTAEFALYRWSGKADEQPRPVKRMSQSDFGPEALIPFKSSPRLMLLSDDGTLPVPVADESQCMEDKLNTDGTCPNKFLLDPNRKTFRGILLTP